MNNYNLDNFKNGLKEFNITLSDSQFDSFIKYYELLIEWNSFMNLTSITEWEDVVTKHFLDSLALIKYNPKVTEVSFSMIDVGTGAGFPGIPLKIAFPNLNITLVDSLNKRVKFLNKVIEDLSLDNIVAFHGRAEDFGHNEDFRGSFDFVVSRAVANLAVLSEYCLPFCKVGGSFISYKSEKINEEFVNGKKAISILGGELDQCIEFNLPDTDIYRNLFCIKKISNSPNKYPRKSGVPSKSPII